MPKKKYYAVKKGVQTGIFETWDECRRMVHGVAGAVYKSFADREEAEQYLNGMAGGQICCRKQRSQAIVSRHM